MPARGRRSAKPFTRRRSAAAFRLRPPVPRMNLFPEPRPGGRSGGEAGAARGCSAPAPSRRAAGLAGVGYGCPFGALRRAFRSPFRHLRRCSFFGGLLPKAFFGGPSRRHGLPTPFCRRSFFGGPSFGYGAAFLCPAEQPGPAPSRLCLLSAPTPLRSVPSPLRPLSAPSRSRPVPVPVPSFGGAPLRRFFSVRGLKNRKNCLDL